MNKHKCHGKHFALWGCSHVPENFFKDINRIACEIGEEIEKRYPDIFEICQCKEKFGSIRIYYAIKTKDDIEWSNEGRVGTSPVWLAYNEGLLKDVDEKDIPDKHDSYVNKAKKLLKPYINKELPSGRILYEFRRNEYKDQSGNKRVYFDAILSGTEPKLIQEIIEEFRYKYPEYAHYLYLFAPYECDCKDDYCICEKYKKKGD